MCGDVSESISEGVVHVAKVVGWHPCLLIHSAAFVPLQLGRILVVVVLTGRHNLVVTVLQKDRILAGVALENNPKRTVADL